MAQRRSEARAQEKHKQDRCKIVKTWQFQKKK